MNVWLLSLDTGHYYDNSGNISVNSKSEAVYLEPFAYHYPNGIGCCCSICDHVSSARKDLVLPFGCSRN